MPNKAKLLLAKTSILKRLVAFLIDLFIINAFLLIPFRKLFEAIPRGTTMESAYAFLSYNPGFRTYITTLTFFAALIFFLYFVLFETILNQTLGKMLFNIYVIPAVKDEKELKEKGPKISFWKAFIRNIFIFPFFPFILLWIIEPLTLIFNPMQQRLLEILTKTRTVERYLSK